MENSYFHYSRFAANANLFLETENEDKTERTPVAIYLQKKEFWLYL